MKNLFLILSLSFINSFAFANVKNESTSNKKVFLYQVWYHCGNGHHGTFYINSLDGAQDVANILCS